MTMQNYDTTYWKESCPEIKSCEKKKCPCGLQRVTLPAAMGDDSQGSPIAPKNGAYCDAIVIYEANKHIYLYSSEGVPTLMNTDVGGIDELAEELSIAQGNIESLEINLGAEEEARQLADSSLSDRIDAIDTSSYVTSSELATELANYTQASDLSTVAVTGDYADLNNLPTIPTVNDSTITIQGNGATVGTFTTNSATDVTLNVQSPVITMTTTDPGEGSALAANNYVAVYGGDPIIMDYSTTEINTGAKWINGKDIYKKTINFGTLPDSDIKEISYNIPNLERVIKIEGYTYNPTNEQSMPINYASAAQFANSVGTYIRHSQGYVVIRTGINRTDYTETYVTLYYTKSS